MKNKIPTLLLVVLSIVLSFSVSLYGQSDNKKQTTITNPLAGTWRLIEFTDLDTLTGKWEYRYGKNPRGFFTYTKNGILNLNISSGNPMIFSEDSSKKMNINYFQMIEYNALGYFGTYTIDWVKSIVTHHVKGGSLPWYIDTDQPRPFTLKADTLIIGNNKSWKRVLVRAD